MKTDMGGIMEQIKSKIENGDCLEVLKKYPDNFFNLIITKLKSIK